MIRARPKSPIFSTKSSVLMKRLAGVIAAVAMLATTSASLGCFWIVADEPEANGLFRD